MANVQSKRQINPHWEILCIPALILIHRFCYNLIGIVNSWNDVDYGPVLATTWDYTIPYIPVFILPYLFTWVYAGFIIFYAAIYGTYDRSLFRYFYLTFLSLTCIECIFWYLFPASILIRTSPEVLAHNGLLGSLTAYVYEHATPWNVIPSAHIAFSYTVWLLSKHFAPAGKRWLFLFLFFSIALSVVFIKNHYLVDIAAGMLLGKLTYFLVFLPAVKHDILARFSTTHILIFSSLLCTFIAVTYSLIVKYQWN